MPKLWDDTIEAHRRAVVDATLDSTAALVAEHGLRGVTMSRIAATTGIGRATLYKYFPDVEAVLVAWHHRQVDHHLAHLVAVRDAAGDAAERLAAVLTAYAEILHGTHAHHAVDVDLVEHLHGTGGVDAARNLLHELVDGLLGEAVAAGAVRGDVAPGELATYCLHALTAAADVPTHAAVTRLVSVILRGLAPTG